MAGCTLVLIVQTCCKSLSVLNYGLLKDSLAFLSGRVLYFHVGGGLEIRVVALKSCAMGLLPKEVREISPRAYRMAICQGMILRSPALKSHDGALGTWFWSLSMFVTHLNSHF